MSVAVDGHGLPFPSSKSSLKVPCNEPEHIDEQVRYAPTVRTDARCLCRALSTYSHVERASGILQLVSVKLLGNDHERNQCTH